MSAHREKTNSIMGLVISVLLHGIFLAGCIAIDFTFQQDKPASTTGNTEITRMSNPADIAKTKS